MDHLHGSAEVPTLAQDLHNACRFLFLRRSCRLQSGTPGAVLPTDLIGAYHEDA